MSAGAQPARLHTLLSWICDGIRAHRDGERANRDRHPRGRSPQGRPRQLALSDGAYAAQLNSRDEQELAHWCRSEIGASVNAIDAPCRWSDNGTMRPCERELMQQGIFCFATPSREKAERHPRNYFGWMLRGALYQALEATHPLLTGLPSPGRRCCFETFPHAISWHLRGGEAQAARKRSPRRELLAHHVAIGAACHVYGEPDTGLIVVPQGLPALDQPHGSKQVPRPPWSWAAALGRRTP